MPNPSDEMVRVYDHRTGAILPNLVPRHHLTHVVFGQYIREVPSNGRYAKPNPDVAVHTPDTPALAGRVDFQPTAAEFPAVSGADDPAAAARVHTLTTPTTAPEAADATQEA